MAHEATCYVPVVSQRIGECHGGVSLARMMIKAKYGCVWKCCVPHCTQWFCWSLSLWNGYDWEYTQHFQTNPYTNRYQPLTDQLPKEKCQCMKPWLIKTLPPKKTIGSKSEGPRPSMVVATSHYHTSRPCTLSCDSIMFTTALNQNEPIVCEE